MTNVDDERNPVQWVYAARNNLELEERYDQWAKRYDEDLEEDYGWLGPALALDACRQYLSNRRADFGRWGRNRVWWARCWPRPDSTD